jgi:glycyl-tRNA synthetase
VAREIIRIRKIEMIIMNNEKIVEVAKRRGFFWPGSEIYNPIAGFWHYGPVGLSLKKKIENEWRKAFVKEEGFYEVEGTNVMPEPVFVASGHVRGFSDPLVQCKKCKSLHRADKLIEKQSGEFVPEHAPLEKFDEIISKKKIRCQDCGGELDKTKFFNMMFKLHIGATNEGEVAYLRPETCQVIFVDFLNVYRTMRTKLPFGIVQIGKSFRNEISPRQSLLRQREFTQAEAEIFFDSAVKEFPNFEKFKDYKLNLQMVKDDSAKKVKAKDAVNTGLIDFELIAYYLAKLQNFLESIGIPLESIRLREHTEDERPFYAKLAFDCEVKTDEGWVEIAANHYRTDYDLKCHMKASGKDLSIVENDKKVVPHVWEISEGIDRTIFLVMVHSFREGKERGWNWFAFPPSIAPFAAAVFPLVSKDKLPEKAREVYEQLKKCYDVYYDESGSIGKRYARADEVGVPWCITVDHDSLKNGDVTVRDRDSTKQVRVKIKDLTEVMWKLMNEETEFGKVGKAVK